MQMKLLFWIKSPSCKFDEPDVGDSDFITLAFSVDKTIDAYTPMKFGTLIKIGEINM